MGILFCRKINVATQFLKRLVQIHVVGPMGRSGCAEPRRFDRRLSSCWHERWSLHEVLSGRPVRFLTFIYEAVL